MSFILEFWYNEGAQILLFLPLIGWVWWADTFYPNRYSDAFTYTVMTIAFLLVAITYFGASKIFYQFAPQIPIKPMLSVMA